MSAGGTGARLHAAGVLSNADVAFVGGVLPDGARQFLGWRVIFIVVPGYAASVANGVTVGRLLGADGGGDVRELRGAVGDIPEA